MTQLTAPFGTLSRTLSAALALVLLMTAMRVLAAPPGPLLVQDAWMRKAPGVDTAAVYMVLRNTSEQAITVTGVSSPLADHVMIHETSHEGGQARMRMQEKVLVAAGKSVAFEPGGLHVMFTGFRQDVRVGQNVPLTLLLENGDEVQVNAVVRPLGAQ